MTDITSGEGEETGGTSPHPDENPSIDATTPDPSSGVKCTAHTSSGRPCRNWAIQGATVCRMHGGSAPQVRRKAAERLALGRARVELEREGRLGGGTLDVDPADAMLAMVREAAFNVAVLRDMVAGLATEMDAAAPGAMGPVPAIAGLMGSTSKVMEAAPHVWVNMYDAERERLVKWSKACRDAGVDEAVVRLEERRADELAGVLRGIEAALLAVVLAAVPAEVAAAVRGVWQTEAPRVIEAEVRKVAGPA